MAIESVSPSEGDTESSGLRLEESEARVDALIDVIERAVLNSDFEIDRDAMATVIGMLDVEQKAMRRLWEQYAKKCTPVRRCMT